MIDLKGKSIARLQFDAKIADDNKKKKTQVVSYVLLLSIIVGSCIFTIKEKCFKKVLPVDDVGNDTKGELTDHSQGEMLGDAITRDMNPLNTVAEVSKPMALETMLKKSMGNTSD